MGLNFLSSRCEWGQKVPWSIFLMDSSEEQTRAPTSAVAPASLISDTQWSARCCSITDNLLNLRPRNFPFLPTSGTFILSVGGFRQVSFRKSHLKITYLEKLHLYPSSMSMGLFYLPTLSILSLIYVSWIVLATEAKLTAMSFPGSSLILSYP